MASDRSVEKDDSDDDVELLFDGDATPDDDAELQFDGDATPDDTAELQFDGDATPDDNTGMVSAQDTPVEEQVKQQRSLRRDSSPDRQTDTPVLRRDAPKTDTAPELPLSNKNTIADTIGKGISPDAAEQQRSPELEELHESKRWRSQGPEGG